jgi:hypothetical protein
MSKELYNSHEIKKTLKAQNFGHAALVMIHNPVTFAKEQAELADKEAEKKSKKEDKA